MSFVYPQFLWGLLALSIPIIIHLFNFRRTKKVYFSNNFFLKNVKEATTSKLKVKHLLILLARLLFIAFLVFTFAQPFLPGKESAESGANAEKLVYIYLDNSLSMSSELSSNARGIDQGVNYIEEILALYPRNTQYKFLTNEFDSFSRVPKSSNELSELIAEVELTGVVRSAEQVLGKIQSDIDASAFNESSDIQADIYVISDFQKSTIGNPDVFSEDTVNNIKLVPISSSFESNVYVDSIYLANPFVLADDANELAVVLRNDGNEDVTDQIVRLLINEEQVASASLNLPANADGTINFTLNFPLENDNRCQLIFEDYPVTFDNEFFFTLNLGDKISVLEIKSEQLGRLDSTTVAQVYANRSIFDLQSYSIENLDYSLIESSDLVILNEVGGGGSESDQAVTPYLREYLGKGGHLMFVPPLSGDLSLLAEVTGNSGISAEQINRPDSVEAVRAALANLDMANPFYDGMFEGRSENFVMPAAEQLMQHNLQGEPLLRYRTGEPYLLKLSSRYIMSDDATSDQISFFATPLRAPYTEIHRHAVYVPIMYRIASRSKSMNNQLYYHVDNAVMALETASFGGDSSNQASASPARRYIYKLVRGEEEVIPTQRLISGRLLMEIPQGVIKAGFYGLIRAEESTMGEESSESLLSLSFNIDTRESLIAQYKVDELQSIFENSANVNIYEAEDVESFADMLRSEQTNIALWKYALLLCLFFLLTEILLIRFL
ncbi:BatA domain-containing protein [Catalinimonas niigatensis]|uniref:BatA domain-containing protein n=1 Tax=Catalinimonas niigatensis TaxID=1397264 RepID=UPI002666510D|nr:BatA domain-containing protein [Catalinimonas niigatensis]WPP52245.1 BatA domain-containing protein [Catalinimonas niigatensis]